jgi:thiol-disulfide isomerase/thioredoxin
MAGGCGGGAAQSPQVSSVGHAHGTPILFSYRTTGGGVFSSDTTRGRATVVLFVTTYDPVCQLVAQKLDEVLRAFRPRANGGAIVLEPEQNAMFADVFRSTLHLSYPVAIADAGTRLGDGPFGAVHVVPTVVVLDRDGREVWRKVGMQSPRQLEAALASASR